MASSKRADRNWVKTLGAIQEERGISPTGDGWKKLEELREMMGCGTQKAYKIINEGVSLGQIEVFQGSEANSYGRIVRRIWYKVKE